MKKFLLLLGFFAQAVTAQTIPSYVPTNGLVGWWPFNGNANDLSGNGHNGIVNGAVPTADRYSNSNSAFNFDGINDLIRIPHSADLNLMGSFSASIWVNVNSLPINNNNHTLITKRDDNGICCSPNVPYGLFITYQVSMAPQYYKMPSAAFASGGSYSFSGSDSIININTWNNLVYVYTTDTMKIYLNTVLIDKQLLPNSARSSNTSDLLIGSVNRGGAEWMNGKLDDIGIWNRALTLAEIQSLYFACNDTLSQNPANTTASFGTTATFTALSSASGATYQWQVNNGSNFVNVSNAGQFSGATTNTLTITSVSSANNGLQVRCIVDHGDCVDTSDIAVLTSCFSLSTQPFDQYVVAGNSASFSTATNDPSCTYQWQTNAGFGFQNLSNAGQFSGVTSNTLTVSTVSQANNNQVFRCLVTAGTCQDTTAAAKIVLSGVGVSENALMRLSVSPTPTRGLVDLGFTLEGTYSLIGIDGRTVQSGSLRQILDFSNQPAGVYSLRLETSAGNRVVKVVKE